MEEKIVPPVQFDYEFPRITHIDDIMPAIAGWSAIRIGAPQDGFRFVTYIANDGNVFRRDVPGWEIRRECRGLAFNSDGVLVSRPFHKFFNLEELPETHGDLVQVAAMRGPVKALASSEKIDGSMVRPILLDDGWIRLATKAGFTAVAAAAERDLDALPDALEIRRQLAALVGGGWTPILEWSSVDPQHQIVISHSWPALTLLDARETHSGQYRPYPMVASGLTRLGHMYLLAKSTDMGMPEVRAREGSEGVVLTIVGGHRVKVKSDWYIGLHRLLNYSQPRHIIRALLDRTLDDIRLQLVQLGREQWVDRIVDAFLGAMDLKAEYLDQQARAAQEQYARFGTKGSRKRIAVEFVPRLRSRQDAWYLFGALDGRDIDDAIQSKALAATNSGKSFDEFCEWLGVSLEAS